MIALLKLVSLKDWLWAALVAAMLGLFGWYTIHERDAGEAKIIAADTRTALVAQAKDKAIEEAAQNAANTIGEKYEKAVIVPAVGDLGIVCDAPASGGVPKAPDNRPSTAKAPARTDGPTFDPSGAALTVGRDADAQITALQAQVLDLVNRMNGSTK